MLATTMPIMQMMKLRLREARDSAHRDLSDAKW